MADQILSPLLAKLVDYIAVPVGRQFSYLFRYHGNLEEFRKQLGRLEIAGRDVKLRVEAAENNGEKILPSVEEWLKRVKVLADESQRFVGEEDAISKCCFNGPLNLKVRYQRSRKAMKKAAEFDRFKEEGRFVEGVAVAGPAPAPAPPQIRFMKNENEFDFESRRSVFKEIMDAMKDDGVEMIGIWGMPGIGKTTLVKRVAKYAKDQGLFEVVAMAVVSQSPSVKAIQDEIADAIRLKLTSETIQGRANELHQRLLAVKKILVILDDIWDSIELIDIGIPSGSQHKGCKVILTSRIEDVCKKMRTGKNFKIDIVSEIEALRLFMQMSGVDDRSSEKGQLAEELSKECGGLPLCIVIVARDLLNKEPNDWTDMLNRLRNSDVDRKVRAAIELSYNNVGREEEKKFFLLCALFPEDYNIPVRVLFEYGIGLNLFKNVYNVHEKLVRAHKLASSLKSSCLLLDAGSEEFVKMHDVVRDAALAIASEGENAFFVRSEAQGREWQDKTAISFRSHDVKKLPDPLECPRLQILMLNSGYTKWQLPDNFFTGMKNLIVLDMSGMKFVRLPQSFAGLENLRTLRLSGCKLGDISTIEKLQNLVSLTFEDSNIEVLPKEVGELSNLTLLDLSGCVGLKVITPGVIQNLSQLEVLYVKRKFLSHDEDSIPKNASLSELIHLSRLKILEIFISNASMLPDEVLFGNLIKFKISIGDDYFIMKKSFCQSSQILKLKNVSENELTKAGIKMLMKKAQHLELEDVSGISVALPSHLGGFRTLKELFVSRCKDVNYVLDMNESEYEPKPPSLQVLHLIDLPFLKEISKDKFPILFVSKLEHLKLHQLPRLVHLWQFDVKSVALANLTFMSVKSCNKLEYVLEHNSAKSLLKLKELKVGKCGNLQAICLSKEHDNIIDFPQLSHLKLSELENLTSFSSKFTSESTLFGKQVIFRALEKLDINNLQKLEKIWHIHTLDESFFQLKVLKLTQCSKLLVVFPPQATSALRNLEEICIENCYKLETLFPLDDVPLTVGDEMVHFQLKVLKLTQCPQLLVVFPPQTTLTLRNLEEICIENCDKLETLFQSDDAPLTIGNEMILFPRLLTLKLVNLPKFTAILSTTSQNISQATEICSAMKIKTLCRLDNLESIVDQQLLTFFLKLKKLQLVDIGCISSIADQLHIIKGLEALEELIIQDNNGRTFPKVIATIPKLRKLKLHLIHEPIEWSESLYRCKGFQSLTSLSFYYCSGLKSLLTPSAVSCLVQLEELCVTECEIMESIVREISEKQNFDKVIEFSKLRTLMIENLPRLTNFYNGECALKFPCLGVISIKCCSQLRTFTSMTRETAEPSHQNFVSEALFGPQVSFGKLTHLNLRELDLIEEIWHGGHPATIVGKLCILKVEHCDRLLKIFPSNVLAGLQNLKVLSIQSCASLEHVFALKDDSPILSNLRVVVLYNLHVLKQLWWNESNCESFGLPKLIFFMMDTCPALQYVFDASVANHLEKLASLYVENCCSIVEIVEEKAGRKIKFPLLDDIWLVNLPCFKGLSQSVEFSQAQYVLVHRNLNMTKSPSGTAFDFLQLERCQDWFSFFKLFLDCRHRRIRSWLDADAE